MLFHVTHVGSRPNLTDEIVRYKRRDKGQNPAEVNDVHSRRGNIGAEFAAKTREGKCDSNDVGDDSLNINAASIVVVFVGGSPIVERRYENISFSEEEVWLALVKELESGSKEM